MVVYTQKEIEGKVFGYAYSDAKMKIQSTSGAKYDDVIYPFGAERTYIETDEPIEGDAMKYSARAILRELRELGKYEAFRQLLTSIGYDWEFLSANYLSEDDEDFKRLKIKIVDAGIVGTITELDAMLAKCVWTAE